MNRTTTVALFSLTVLAAAGCNPNDEEGGAPASEVGSSCDSTLDCGEGLTCLSVGQAAGACQLNCSASADECGAEATCGGVGSLSVDVCQSPESVADEDNAPEEEDRTSVPCTVDEDCSVMQSGAVCATWRDYRECTITCSGDSGCNPPAMMGVTMAFSECAPDEGDIERDVCLPNEDCFTAPMSCIDLGMPF